MVKGTICPVAPEGADASRGAGRGDAIQALLSWLDRGDEVDRCNAARALGRLRAAGAVTALVGRLTDADVDVCVDAAAALAEIGDVSATAALERAVREDPDPEVKTAAIAALGRLAGTAQVPLLMEIARSRPANLQEDPASEWDPWWDMQLSAVRALGELNAVEAAPTLDSLLDDEEGQDIEAELLIALARIEGEGERRVAVRLAAGPARQRRRSTSALARSVSPRSLEAIGRALLDRDPDVRVAALEAIATRDAKRFLPAILLLFRDGEATVRAAAVGAAEQLIADLRPGGRLFDDLIELVRDRDPRVRATALRALAAGSDSPEVDDEIARLLADPDPGVREAACTLAARGSIPEVDIRLLAIAADGSAPAGVRRAAVRSLGARGGWNEGVARVFSEIIGTPRSELRLAVLESLVQLHRAASDGGETVPDPLELVLAALRGESLTAAAPDPDPDPRPRPGQEIPVERAGAAPKFEPVALAEALPPIGEDEVRPARSSLEAIAIDNAEVALARADHDGSEPNGVALDEETAEYVALTEQNEETARWLFAREGRERDLDIRRLAARTLKRCPLESVAAALITVLDEEDSKLRLEAASALAEIAGDPAARTVLAESVERLTRLAASDDRNLRLMAIRALVRSGVGDAGVLLRAIEDPEPVVRSEALRALAVRGHAGPAARSEEGVRVVLDAALGRLGDPAADVRLAAAGATTHLVARADPPPVPARELAGAIIDAVFSGTGDRVREFARTLRSWDLESASAACLARLEALTHSTERRFAIELLEELHVDVASGMSKPAPTQPTIKAIT